MGIEVAVILFLVGIALIPIEMLVPSGGVLTALSFLAIIGSVVVAFDINQTEGFVFLASACTLTPVSWFVVIKAFPHTGLGRRVIQGGSDLDPAQRRRGVSLELKALHGKVGLTVTDLRPSGTVEIAGERYDVVSKGDFVDVGQQVTVSEVDGNRVVVEPIR